MIEAVLTAPRGVYHSTSLYEAPPTIYTSQMVGDLCSNIDLLAGLAGPDTRVEVTGLFCQQNLQDALARIENADDLSKLLASVDRFDIACAGGVGMQDLSCINVATVRELVARQDPGLFSLLGRAVKAVPGAEAIRMVQAIAEPWYGAPVKWRQLGIPRNDLPEFMQELAAKPYFATVCLESAVEQFERIFKQPTEGELAPEVRAKENLDMYLRNKALMTEARAFERAYLTDVLGVSPELAHDFRFAIQQRTMIKAQDGTTLPVRKGGGIDFDPADGAWKAALKGFTANVENIGVEQANKLHGELGTINFDGLTSTQLNTLVGLANNDPWVLRRLQKGEVKLLLRDAFDKSLFIGNATDSLDPGDGTMIVLDVRRPEDIVAKPQMVTEQFGIKPSKLYIGAHGAPGLLAFGRLSGPKGGFVFFASERQRESFGVPARSIAESHLDRVAREYMQPDRQTGIRTLVFLSCNQAAEVGEEPERILPSTTEVVLRHSMPEDRLAVAGAAEMIHVRRGPTTDDCLGPSEARFMSRRFGPVKTQVYEWAPDGSVRHTEQEAIPGTEARGVMW